MKVQVLDQSGNPVEEMNWPEEVLNYPVKDHLVYETVVNYLANQRQGTASTKTKAEISGGGRKPWRQKGTGRPGVGSNRSPLWRTEVPPLGQGQETMVMSCPKRPGKML